MPRSTTTLSLYRFPATPVAAKGRPLSWWRQVRHVLAVTVDVMREARALERKMMPRHFADY